MDNFNTMSSPSNFTDTKKSGLSDIIIIVIIIIVLWLIFGKKSEKFDSDNTNNDSYYKNSYGMSLGSDYSMGDQKPQYYDAGMNYNKPVYTDQYKDVGNSNILTGDDRSVKLMNDAGESDYKSQSNLSCNMLGLDTKDMDQYKKNYYKLYEHQIKCPKKCLMNKQGMKKCGLDSDAGCNGVFTTDYNLPDTNMLAVRAMKNANEKPCATCNYKPTINKLNRALLVNTADEIRNLQNQNASQNDNLSLNSLQTSDELYRDLSPEVIKADQARLNNQKVSDANVSNFVNFEDNVYLDTLGETAASKIAQMRTCQDGTCNLKSFGKKISNAYDNLVSNPFYENRYSCNPNQITGILEDKASTDNYADL